jgi:hypothetical protein
MFAMSYDSCDQALGRTPRHMTHACTLLGITLLCTQLASAAESQRAVVELFTSTGCSSCPPADAIAGHLRKEPALIVLSYHVDYWDSAAWKDTFSSKDSTARQYEYAHALNEHSVATPEMIVNGARSVLGAQEPAIRHAVQAESQAALPVQVNLAKQPDGGFALTLEGTAPGAEVWEIGYVRTASIRVRGGENGGRTLETYNNVTRILDLGAYSPGTRSLPALKSPEDGLAVLVQAPGMGRILGASAN